MNLRLVYTALSLIVCANAFAQVKGGHNQKLAKLYNSGKYEICLFKAEDMCEDPAASREAEPHLYAAMCMVKLYESPDAEVAAAIALALDMEQGGDTYAAIATAVHLYLSDSVHDVEPGIVTIHRTESSWNNKALTFRKLPR